MNLTGTNASQFLKLMKIFSTKRNIPFSTAKPFETEIGLKAAPILKVKPQNVSPIYAAKTN